MPRFNSTNELEEYRKNLLELIKPEKPVITVCGGTGCLSSDGQKLYEAFKAEVENQKLDVQVKQTGCMGLCELGPLVTVYPQHFFYHHVKIADIAEILETTIKNGNPVEKLLYTEGTGAKAQTTKDIQFYAKQKRIVFAHNGLIRPTEIDDYLSVGGYTGLRKALGMKPDDVITEVEKSGLRGRGGGGFLTGKKWRSTAKAVALENIKYVLANGDEGDPGAFMDRSLMEGDPHSVIEGMIIGAFAVGANHGYIYVREEYPLAVQNLTNAINQAEEYGLLGENILGTGFNYDIKISRGGGAFVCGESTALMASIEGKPGEPRPKHIHTAVSGLFKRPTILNNVETWANVPLIIKNGADWYRQTGTEKSPGTKIFSLVGKVNNTGLVEVPMGITLREIIFEIGGGIIDNKKFKGVQTGGPSGGVIPEKYLDKPIDFDELTELGSMMGSGGMIVCDEHTCMVDFARYFTEFLSKESCGKCTACREGVYHMLQVLDKITKGLGVEEDIEKLKELSIGIRDMSLCALGGSAPNPVLSTLEHFLIEYDEHIKNKKCRSGVCSDLIDYWIDPEKCIGCQMCARNCPVQCISGEKKLAHVIDSSKCIRCGVCVDSCPVKVDAVRVISPRAADPANLANQVR